MHRSSHWWCDWCHTGHSAAYSTPVGTTPHSLKASPEPLTCTSFRKHSPDWFHSPPHPPNSRTIPQVISKSLGLHVLKVRAQRWACTWRTSNTCVVVGQTSLSGTATIPNLKLWEMKMNPHRHSIILKNSRNIKCLPQIKMESALLQNGSTVAPGAKPHSRPSGNRPAWGQCELKLYDPP